jgi:hypothetical protein
MFEQFRSFADYVRDYELARAEGVLLRHLNSVYKVLRQTVPDTAKTEPVREMELYLGAMVRQVDSSLLEEWEKMQRPETPSPSSARTGVEETRLRPPGTETASSDITRDEKGFRAAVRQQIFVFLREWANQDTEQALAQLHSIDAPDGQPWTSARLLQTLEQYHLEHERLCLDPEARNLRHTYVKPVEGRRSWTVEQVLVDPEAHNDWVALFDVDLEESTRTGWPALRLVRLGPIGSP